MVDFFDKIYRFNEDTCPVLKKLKIYSILRFIIRLISNVILTTYFFFTRTNPAYRINQCNENENNVIVSLTSFPKRINKVWLVIETILRQSVKPEKIVLWLSREQFSSIDVLPSNLLSQTKRGLEIRLEEGDLRSHKKYFYTLMYYPDKFMLTIDDDIFYRSTMIENLLHYARKYQSSVVSQYCKKIITVKGKIAAYSQWPRLTVEYGPAGEVFFCSGGGTLFPPNSFENKLLQPELFMSLTPSADDIWLNTIYRICGTKTLQTVLNSDFLPVIFRKNNTLHSLNNIYNHNDLQIDAVRKFFIEREGIDPFQAQ